MAERIKNRMKKYFRRRLHILLLMLFSGCANFNNIEVGKIEDLIFNSFKENTVELSLKVPITNPNNFGFKIKEINLRTSVNDYYLGRVLSDDVIIIPAKSSKIHDLRIKLRITNIIQGITVFFSLLKEEDIEVDLEGYIKFKSVFITRKIDIKESAVINSFR